ncbi:amidohydrolase family protein [Actinomadura opuntiae]|uniref:amidohydrolase family protein n=1 Tax=Actinomadura sp. OS1-43 TaxID=604315 RepID=UPI00255AC7C9|nr:amidohydrolase family protein [Actinomadura sp. OS1-43]MDL4814806.1 amidohydrolase family protein [Actinomadura sp. OS1-43]
MPVVRAGRAFDGVRQLHGGAAVFVEDGRIRGVEPATAPVPDGWEVADFPGGTVLPGLIDMHVHLCGDSRNGALDRLAGYTGAELGAVIDRALRDQAAAGVTTVRDLGDRHWTVLERRDRGPERAVPQIVAAGPPITCPQGHCWSMGGEASGPDGLRAAVRERAERGADVVKVMGSGGVMTAGTEVSLCQFGDDDLRLIVEEAHRAGLPVTVHAHGLAAIEQAVRAGTDGIEHCTCLTESGVRIPEELLDALARQRITVCPTLGKAAGVEPAGPVLAMLTRFGMRLEDREGHAAAMYRAGVRLVSGADCGISAGKAHGILPSAIACLVSGGVPAADALASATSRAAEECGLGDRKGLLRAGHDADLVVVDGDPLTDIGALARVTAVMIRGEWATAPDRH